MGGRAHVLNVTTLTWMDRARVQIPDINNVWTHTAVVIVPRHLEFTNVSVAVINGDCNKEDNKAPNNKDYMVVAADQLAHQIGSIVVAMKQIPNCPAVFTDDPIQKGRHEDSLMSWSWKEFMVYPEHDPTWMVNAPMAKASHHIMRAARSYINNNLKVANITSWMVTGASKRGWATWLTAAVNCTNCEKVVGIFPLVPIVPPLNDEIHYQWQSFGGFSWAFKDYMESDVIKYIDDPLWQNGTEVIDPQYYPDTLGKIPKMILVASSDEFMQFDWTALWFPNLIPGETHLNIEPNTEHTQLTGVLAVLSTASTFARSVMSGRTEADRPYLNYTYDKETEIVEVFVEEKHRHLVQDKGVNLRYAETLQTKRRDFRWMTAINDQVGPCKLPSFVMPKKKDLCFATIFWKKKPMELVEPGHWKVSVPQPQVNHWMGFFAQVKFNGEGSGPVGREKLFNNMYHMSSVGWVTPDTLPYPPCVGAGCKSLKV
mmetsp:Transcript_3461/g.5191  ORF Transcript_3461/g.5191 Transcript_3461/m.5191 type:complete len:485 (-) Transcript_3461:50-1504(-)|eukprot:CAMPEP_0170481452 /NCGR_PEP_ID=MMETSP0208-20121228/1885_1 /TAXON_ID=197538 /ORGANISM="Strombidium inclinatum, Strain S3" /LENGTH=484 /DNA_ID=CAMNT_0010754155 /DNA_START=143 /DNA_END=1597 /DNA_ORIENTATION=+